jgi:CheY-like chemotaxis protein
MPPPALPSGLRVLVLEAGGRPSLPAILEARGVRIVAAASAQEARAVLHEIDVVIGDVRAPGGLALLREIRTGAPPGRIPAIAVSGPERGDGAESFSAGYDIRLCEPVTPDLLLASIHQLTGSRMH